MAVKGENDHFYVCTETGDAPPKYVYTSRTIKSLCGYAMSFLKLTLDAEKRSSRRFHDHAEIYKADVKASKRKLLGPCPL